MLAELNSEASYLDIVKVTTDEMNAFLEEKLGIQLDETKKIGLENFYYLDQYDSFYLVIGDTNFDWCLSTTLVNTWNIHLNNFSLIQRNHPLSSRK